MPFTLHNYYKVNTICFKHFVTGFTDEGATIVIT